MTNFRHAFGLCLAIGAGAACARGSMPPAARPVSALDPHFQAASRIADVLARPGCLWVTDADGTLWTDDIGEGFLHRLVADKALVAADAQGDAYATYEAKVKADRATGYAWAAQAMAGLAEADVQARADAFAREFVPKHLFPGMRALLDEAKAKGCEVYIVSASNEWIVRAAAPYLGLDPAHALGIRVEVDGGKLTDRVIPSITFRQGKVETIQARIGRMPALVSGDSAGDLEMLGAATGAAVLVKHDYTDPSLVEKANAAGWLVEALAKP